MITLTEVKWIKITTNMFDDEKIKLIDAMPERDTIFYIWMRLLVQAGKCNAGGYIFLSENVPYTDEMFSTIFNRPLNSVRLALKTLSSFGMIERSENNDLKITNWEKHQNVEGLDKVRAQNRLRKQKQREKQKELNSPSTSEEDKSHVMSRDSHAIEREREKEIDIDKEIDKERESKENTLSDDAIKICQYYSELKPGQDITAQLATLQILIEQYGFDWCKEALQITVEKKNRFILGYMETILKNWTSDGKEEKPNGSARQNTGTGPGKTWDFSKFEG